MPDYHVTVTVTWVQACDAENEEEAREIVKDTEDLDGDYNLKINTLPVLIGKKEPRKSLHYFVLFR